MKKFLTLLMTICLIAGAFCISAFAANTPDPDTVLRISAELKKGGSPVVIEDYDNFQDGWNDAMDIAGDSDEMEDEGYARIVVDLYDDWNADDGEFTDEVWNGPGFDNDTIFITDGAKVTLNLNGHTINRGLTSDENDGEVIFIDDDADVIINNGTITGGFSNSEGGGLYIEGGAKVTLNDVHIDGNSVEGDDGAAIYMYGGSTLTMNGGSISNNFLDGQYILVDEIKPYGSLCVKDSTAILNNVTIDGNYSENYSARGVAIHATNSTVKMSNCTVSNNSIKGVVTDDIIYANDSSLTITNTDFINNNILDLPEKVSGLAPRLFYLEDSKLTLTGGTITKNCGNELFFFNDAEADITGVTITDNKAAVINTDVDAQVIEMTDCTLNNNNPRDNSVAIKTYKQGELVMTNCDLGNTTFSNIKLVDIVTSPVSKEEALIGISGILEDGTTVFTEYYKTIAYGWSYAMAQASSEAYDRIVVDLYADWTSYENGRFADSLLNGKGFYDYTILVPEKARITLNLNGHTINRLLDNAKENGEVILIEREADVIINNGTISGGHSSNSAGGIQINDYANVTLNDVCIFDNEASQRGNGAGIAVRAYADLTMNGGSLTENRVENHGTIYAENGGVAILNNVAIKDNFSTSGWSEGVAIAASNRGAVVLNDCVVSGNGVPGEHSTSTLSIVYGWSATFIFTNTDFIGNASAESSALFYCSQSGLTMNGGNVSNNNPNVVFLFSEGGGRIEGVTVTDNASRTLGLYSTSGTVTFKECTFNNNKSACNLTDSEVMVAGTLSIVDCDLGNTELVNPNPAVVGSVFGDGSLTVIISLLALIASAATIGICISLKKKIEAIEKKLV